MTTADTVCYIAQPIYTLLFNAFLFSTGTLDSGDLFHVTVKEVNIALACIFFGIIHCNIICFSFLI